MVEEAEEAGLWVLRVFKARRVSRGPLAAPKALRARRVLRGLRGSKEVEPATRGLRGHRV